MSIHGTRTMSESQGEKLLNTVRKAAFQIKRIHQTIQLLRNLLIINLMIHSEGYIIIMDFSGLSIALSQFIRKS